MDRWKSRGLAAVLALGATLLAPAGEAVEAGRQQGMSRFGNVRNPSSGGVVPQHAGTATPSAAADEVLLLLKEPGRGAAGLTARGSSLEALLQKHGADRPRPVLRETPRARALAQEGPASELRRRLERLVRVRIKGSVQEAAAEFAANPEVEYAQPNYRFRMAAAANDPYYGSSGSWGQAHADMWGARTLNVGRAWDRTRGEGVVVAVIDTGVDVQHEDLAANVWSHPGEIPDNGLDDDGNGYIDDVHGWNFVAANGTPYDAVGHGTHVAGIIAAVGDNGRGIVGVAPRAKVMALKALNDDGWALDSDLVAAFIYAADMGADIVNASFGGYNDSRALAEAVRYAAAKGVLIVAAAGNETTDTGHASPAGLPEVLTVGALTPERLRAGFSNYGERIDVYAPGEHVLSLLAAGSWFSTLPEPILDGKYMVMGGTSMAAPHVAGVAALVLSQHPNYTAEQIRALLRSTARDVGAAGWDILFGYGVVDAGAATAPALAPADLTAWLTSPGPYASDRLSAYNRGRYQVRGSALGAGFARYRLEYAPLAGVQPSGPFRRISESTRPVQDGELGVFDASALPDGEYLLRLTTWSSLGRKSESHRRLVKDSALVPGFPQFTAPTGAPPFGPWAFWGPASLTVADLDGDGEQEVLAMHENTIMAWTPRGTMLPGFPIELPRTPNPFGGYERIPAFSLGDLDGNGDLELVVLVPKTVSAGDTAEQASPLHAWHHDGTPVAGFPSAPFPLDGVPPGVLLRLGTGFAEAPSPIVRDLDGDGRAEIVVEYGSGNNWDFPLCLLFVVRGDGTVAPGWPHIIDTRFVPYPLPRSGGLRPGREGGYPSALEDRAAAHPTDHPRARRDGPGGPGAGAVIYFGSAPHGGRRGRGRHARGRAPAARLRVQRPVLRVRPPPPDAPGLARHRAHGGHGGHGGSALREPGRGPGAGGPLHDRPLRGGRGHLLPSRLRARRDGHQRLPGTDGPAGLRLHRDGARPAEGLPSRRAADLLARLARPPGRTALDRPDADGPARERVAGVAQAHRHAGHGWRLHGFGTGRGAARHRRLQRERPGLPLEGVRHPWGVLTLGRLPGRARPRGELRPCGVDVP